MTDDKQPNLARQARKYGRLTIHITEKEVNEGILADSRKCMIAEAVKHSLPDVKTVSVDLATVRFTDKKSGTRYVYMTPRAAQQALVQFDQGIKPEPFTIRLQTLFQIRPKPVGRKSPTQGIMSPSDYDSKPTQDRQHAEAPVKVGGQPMPKAALGYIRRFGLRTLPTGTPAGQMPFPKEAS